MRLNVGPRISRLTPTSCNPGNDSGAKRELEVKLGQNPKGSPLRKRGPIRADTSIPRDMQSH